jgi:transmembrane sensor
MKQSSDNKIDALLSEQAAAWFVRLVANDLSLRERREYLAWLKASGRHVEALLDIYRYHGYGRKAKLNCRVSSNPDPGGKIIPFTPRGGVAVIPHRAERERRRSGVFKIAAAVAGIVFSLGVAYAVKTTYIDQHLTTGPAEWNRALLADGSVLRVGPNTKVRWSFTDLQRMLVLSRGEAVFEVAKDPLRPFVVTTRIGDVRAVGTEFAVALVNASTAVVTVAHGKVVVSKPSQGRFLINGAHAIADLGANQQLVLSGDQVQPVQAVDASRELQWAAGYYEFRGEKVKKAVDEFNRRNRIQVVLSDAAVGEITMPFTTVRLDDPETFAVMLGARPDVQMAYEDSERIRLMAQ